MNDKEVHKQLGLKDGVELNVTDRISVAQGKFVEMITGGLIDSEDASKRLKVSYYKSKILLKNFGEM